jgi:hypothetical protein
MDELAHLAWYCLVACRAFIDVPRTARRMVFSRVELRGRVLSQNRPGHPSFERRAAEGRIVELWVPAAGARFAAPLEDFYDAPVNVGRLDGEEWLRGLCPVIPDISDPDAALRDQPMPDPIELLQKSVDQLTESQAFIVKSGGSPSPQVQACLKRTRETIARLRIERAREARAARVQAR